MTECSCIKDIFDFEITSKNCCHTILFQDLSQWVDETYSPYYKKPESYEISIKNVRESGSVQHIVNTEGLTELPIDCEDGIYCFSVINCDGVKLSKYHLLAFDLEKKIDCLVFNGMFEEAKKAQQWVDFAKVFSERQMEQKATESYEFARDILEQFDCKCCD